MKIDVLLILKWLIMLPFLILYGMGIVMGVLIDLMFKPLIFASAFLWSMITEVFH